MPDTLPLVIVRTAISLDGATTGFEIDMGVYYYDLARTFIEDVSLTGVDTILQTTADLAETAMPGPDSAGHVSDEAGPGVWPTRN